MINLGEIKARCEAATPGPWRLPLYSPTVMDDSGTPILNIVGRGEQENADMRFITNARTDIPALLAYIKELEAQLAEAKADHDKAVEDMNSIVHTDKDTYDTPCDFCKYYNTKDCEHPSSCPLRRYYFWKWRGSK